MIGQIGQLIGRRSGCSQGCPLGVVQVAILFAAIYIAERRWLALATTLLLTALLVGPMIWLGYETAPGPSETNFDPGRAPALNLLPAEPSEAAPATPITRLAFDTMLALFIGLFRRRVLPLEEA